jgi:hypothetical protein
LYYIYKLIFCQEINIYMNKYFVYLDLPKVPENLIEPIDVIISKPPKPESNIPYDFASFQTRMVSTELFDWVQDMFKLKCYTQYQIVRRGIPIHKDISRNVAFNYILQTGGTKVLTTIHDESKRLIAYEQIAPMSWHKLKTDEYHCVMGLTTDRVAIGVEILEYKWNDEVPIK